METKTFLVVDDDPAERSILADTIKAAFPGADVRQMGDPDRVLGLIGECEFDCVLMDYNMPQMDGLALAKALRALSPYLALVMVTGVGDETLAADAVRSGREGLAVFRVSLPDTEEGQRAALDAEMSEIERGLTDQLESRA